MEATPRIMLVECWYWTLMKIINNTNCELQSNHQQKLHFLCSRSISGGWRVSHQQRYSLACGRRDDICVNCESLSQLILANLMSIVCLCGDEKWYYSIVAEGQPPSELHFRIIDENHYTRDVWYLRWPVYEYRFLIKCPAQLSINDQRICEQNINSFFLSLSSISF